MRLSKHISSESEEKLLSLTFPSSIKLGFSGILTHKYPLYRIFHRVMSASQPYAEVSKNNYFIILLSFWLSWFFSFSSFVEGTMPTMLTKIEFLMRKNDQYDNVYRNDSQNDNPNDNF